MTKFDVLSDDYQGPPRPAPLTRLPKIKFIQAHCPVLPHRWPSRPRSEAQCVSTLLPVCVWTTTGSWTDRRHSVQPSHHLRSALIQVVFARSVSFASFASFACSCIQADDNDGCPRHRPKKAQCSLKYRCSVLGGVNIVILRPHLHRQSHKPHRAPTRRLAIASNSRCALHHPHIYTLIRAPRTANSSSTPSLSHYGYAPMTTSTGSSTTTVSP
ncbi:hypothetical protein ARMGADRAFT_543472 [Armillaria gallica]|uniref:Uncharacterized protein n=1 Tax=Armillaria gallica TaxID=47427 RepID=A0A2H3DD61_ARMGA|nr:hypothetical protein ARMGADRAFT_543472 [Armillaria gallica]